MLFTSLVGKVIPSNDPLIVPNSTITKRLDGMLNVAKTNLVVHEFADAFNYTY